MQILISYQNQEDESLISIIAGYIYSGLWALSFYGQLYQNYKLKSVEGYSLNYFAMNFSGYLLYTIYLTLGFFTSIKGAGTVILPDLLFVYHAMLMMILYGIQVLIYPVGKNRLSLEALLITVAVWLAVIVEIFLGAIFKVVNWDQFWNPLSVLGYAKLALVLMKCFPQIYWNYKRKSTEGWSIANVLLDLLGGIFSFISAGVSRKNGLNLSKILLGIFTILIDLTFAFQHYYLYPKSKRKSMENSEYQKLIAN